MTAPNPLRTVAAVLVVVLALLTIWSAYNLYADEQAARTPSPVPVASYVGRGNGSFVATLSPNVLCNCTEVSGGNVTLFPSITRSIAVTLQTSVTVGVPASISTADRFTVTLSSNVWSKSIYSSPINLSSTADSTFASTEDRYTFNVSSVESQINAIENATHYLTSSVWLTLTSEVLVSITVSGVTGTLSVGSVGNFTFSPSSILTGFPSRTLTGEIDGPAPPDATIPATAYILLAATAGGLLASVLWYATLSSRTEREGDDPIPALEDLIAPYEEVIAETATVPDPAATVRIDRWEGLVKISDTLGKPILRPSAGKPIAQRTTFYVLDGDIGYLYRYGVRGSELGAPSSTAADLPGGPGATLKRVRSVAARIESLEPADARFSRALARFRRLRALIQARRWVEAERVLAEIEQSLGTSGDGRSGNLYPGVGASKEPPASRL